ncbi:uncharacterized protein LTR77_004179 [Saxophila tyrrhenica]|uniref:Heterokaryon incompatibility domain-containing protein n=1 Tax=Saxophila tyrrhenica TaxID=1690608 RepID=A0AAV9PGA6_9PEZI|nr:hypothetical protein LTR77_004179 [Saxophila tyrrhenica]
MLISTQLPALHSELNDPKFSFDFSTPGVKGRGRFELVRVLDDVSQHLHATCEADVAYQISERPDTPLSVSLIKSWLEECVQTHEPCTWKPQPALPTRVIDVGASNTSDEPRLLVTLGKHGRYLALSYCWGRSQTLTTKRNNFQEHQREIPMRSLPRTLRDAVCFTRFLGIQYLWIDALCIIQDDADDWRREAAKMCSVYEPAVLTLSVLNGTSSDAGFLDIRSREAVVTQLDGCEVALRTPLPKAESAIPSGSLGTRAWTLQERVLAPAVLHIDTEQLYWECCSGLASESYPAIRRARTGKNDVQFGASIHDMKVQIGQQKDSPSMRLWYALLENYCGRLLTNSSDRLPAIKGLATRFQSIVSAGYNYGLWFDDLANGILWRVIKTDVVRPKPKVKSRDTGVPSWSWASFDSRITFDIPGPKASRTALATFEPQRPSKRGPATERWPRIAITGLCQKGVLFKGRGRYTLVTKDRRSRFTDIDCILDCELEDVELFHCAPKPYYCLLIAKEEGSGGATYRYLLLSSAPHSSSTTSSHRVFQREGVGTQYLSHDGEEPTGAGFSAWDIVLV